MKTIPLALLAILFSATEMNAQETSQTTPDSTTKSFACPMAGGMMRGGMGMGGGMMQGGMEMPQGMMQGGMMMGPGMMGQPGMGLGMPVRDVALRAMTFAPGRLLALRESLALTAEQVSALERLKADRGVARQKGMEALRSAAEKLRALFDAERSDPGAVRAAAKEVAELHGMMHATLIADAAAARAVLTESQREEVNRLLCCGGRGGMGSGGGSAEASGAGHERHHSTTGGQRP